jgi:hypothetical protein
VSDALTSIIYVARGEARSTSQRNTQYLNLIADGRMPKPVLTCTGGYLEGNLVDQMGPDPSIAILLGLPGNSVDLMDYFPQNMDNIVAQRNPDSDVCFPTVYGIPENLQKMIFPSFMVNLLEQ